MPEEKVIRYFNNPGFRDKDLPNELRSRLNGKHYHYVEQARRYSDQSVLRGILKHLEPGTIIETPDLTTLVAGSMYYTLDVLAFVIRKGGGIRLEHDGTAITATEQSIPLGALERYRTQMKCAIRTGNSGRPRSALDTAKAKMLKAQGLTDKQIAAQLGVSLKTLQRRLTEEKKLFDVLATRQES